MAESYHGGNLVSREKDKTNDNILGGWERAIQDCKSEIFRSKTRIRQLQRSIRVFKNKIEIGEPWPGKKTATQI